jgi:hypothetical protein
MMPPQLNPSLHRKSRDDAKLLSPVKQGIVDPSDQSIFYHQTPLLREIVHGKFEKMHLAQNIKGARRVQAQLN